MPRAAMRMCEMGCGRPATSQRHHYCDICRAARPRHKSREAQERERREGRASPAERGYGPEHRRLRRRLAPIVDAGLAMCARCGEPIPAGAEWDLGHDDHDRSRYTGPEHAACNRATAGRERQGSRRW